MQHEIFNQYELFWYLILYQIEKTHYSEFVDLPHVAGRTIGLLTKSTIIQIIIRSYKALPGSKTLNYLKMVWDQESKFRQQKIPIYHVLIL